MQAPGSQLAVLQMSHRVYDVNSGVQLNAMWQLLSTAVRPAAELDFATSAWPMLRHSTTVNHPAHAVGSPCVFDQQATVQTAIV